MDNESSDLYVETLRSECVLNCIGNTRNDYLYS
jgi:hypothetical protein